MDTFDLEAWRANLVYRAYIVRTRSGDQLHRVSSITRAGEADRCRSRTDCGCRVAQMCKGTIRYRAGLLCLKCFPKMPDNENLVDVQIEYGDYR